MTKPSADLAPKAPVAGKVVTTGRRPWADGWLGVWRRKQEPTLFQRCLAVHMHYAQHTTVWK